MDKQRENGSFTDCRLYVAVIRLRGEPIQQSPKVVATISDSIQLARMVLERIEKG